MFACYNVPGASCKPRRITLLFAVFTIVCGRTCVGIIKGELIAHLTHLGILLPLYSTCKFPIFRVIPPCQGHIK